MSIELLIEAAEYIERTSRDKSCDHGYASVLPPRPTEHGRRKYKSRKLQDYRNTHNELEKSRRAQLRRCMEKLKGVVPSGPSSSKHTTLGLLKKATLLITSLEELRERHEVELRRLRSEELMLRGKLDRYASQGYRVARDDNSSPVSTASTDSSRSNQPDDLDSASDISSRLRNVSSCSYSSTDIDLEEYDLEGQGQDVDNLGIWRRLQIEKS